MRGTGDVAYGLKSGGSGAASQHRHHGDASIGRDMRIFQEQRCGAAAPDDHVELGTWNAFRFEKLRTAVARSADSSRAP